MSLESFSGLDLNGVFKIANLAVAGLTVRSYLSDMSYQNELIY